MKKYIRHGFIILTIVILTSCSFKQYPNQTQITIERCHEDMTYDEVLKANVGTARRCTKSSYIGNKEASNVEITTDPMTGAIEFKADAVINAQESEYAKAWADRVRNLEVNLRELLDLIPDGL